MGVDGQEHFGGVPGHGSYRNRVVGGYRWFGKPTTAGCLRLDVRALRRARVLMPGVGGSWVWTDKDTGEQLSAISYVMSGSMERDQVGLVELRYRLTGGGEHVYCPLDVTWTICNYGGERPWFGCPGCGKRVAILFLAGGHFRCRTCHGLVYASQHEDRGSRLIGKAQRIRTERLHARFDDEYPPRPKGMHRTTHERLVAEANAADRESWSEVARRFGLLSEWAD